MNKVAIGALLSFLASLFFLALYYKNAYERSIKSLSVYKREVEALIASLKDRELKLKAYLAQKPKMESKIITKYKVIKQKDESCESFKEGVHEILNAFYAAPS